MKSKLAIIAVCVAVISIVIGTAGFNFVGVKNMAEDVEDTSNTLTFDITSISVFAYCARDFFNGATHFEFRLAGYGDGGVNTTGAWFIIYRSYTLVQVGSHTVQSVITEETFTLSTEENPLTDEEAHEAYYRIRYPLQPFLDWERSEYDGIFSGVINALQYIAYIFGMIWGVISLFVLVIVDTVSTAWQLIRLAMRFIGLM